MRLPRGFWDHSTQRKKYAQYIKKNGFVSTVERAETARDVFRIKESKKIGMKLDYYIKYMKFLRQCRVNLEGNTKIITGKKWRNKFKKHMREFRRGEKERKKREEKEESKRNEDKRKYNKGRPLLKDKQKKRQLEDQLGKDYIITKKSKKDKKKKSKKSEDEYKPEFIFRKWKGEHFDRKKKVWITPPKGKWWNPETEQWENGKVRLGYFYWYYEFIFDASKYPDPVPLAQFHKDVAKQVQYGRKYQLHLWSRDHLKTTYLNVGFMLYLIHENPNYAKLGLLNIAWDKDLAGETFDKIKGNLNDNERLINFYGYVPNDERKGTQEIMYFRYQDSDSSYGLRCTSFSSGKITGSHPFYIFLDDIEVEVLSETYMKKFRKTMNNKLIPAVGKRGRFIVTGTIKGFNTSNDVYIYLEHNPMWQVYKYPAANKMPPMKDILHEIRKRPFLDDKGNTLLDENDEIIYETYDYIEVKNREQYIPLYPERYQIEDLVAKRLQMRREGKSDDEFWSEYFLIAVNPGGKYFDKKRIRTESPPGFLNWEAFRQHLIDENIKTNLWLDPGGIGGKGVALGISLLFKGNFITCEMQRLTVPLLDICITIGHLIKKWNVGRWGVEGNFDQENTYGRVIETTLWNFMKEYGWGDWYSHNAGCQNKKDKVQRIDGEISYRIGLKDTPYCFYVKPYSVDFDGFMEEINTFGKDMTNEMKKGFDILDCLASISLHFIGTSSPIWVMTGNRTDMGFIDV